MVVPLVLASISHSLSFSLSTSHRPMEQVEKPSNLLAPQEFTVPGAPGAPGRTGELLPYRMTWGAAPTFPTTAWVALSFPPAAQGRCAHLHPAPVAAAASCTW